MFFQCPNCDKRAKTRKELRELGCDCKSQPLKMAEADDFTKKKEEDERSTSKKVLDFAISKIKKLVISENDSDGTYAIIESNGHVESLNLESKRARQWLNDQYSRNVESNDIQGDDFYKNVTYNIITKAQMNGTERAKIHNRIAQLESQILYDLGTPDWKIVKITPDGTETVNYDITMPILRRTQSLQIQAIPIYGNDKALVELARLLHISEDDILVFIVHLVCMFLDSCSIPMMVFDGSAASLKTTATAAIKRIVDPSGKGTDDNVSAMAEKPEDLITQLNNRYLSSFDNVSFISKDISDKLCRTITGSNNPRRKKYTDDDEVILSFKRKIVLNGIVPTLDYPDLQTRLLSYARKPIDENNRITDQEFNEKFESLLPHLLGKIFTTLQKSLKKYPYLKDKIRPSTRMADFEVWGEIISRELGYTENSFLDSYRRKTIDGQISLVASHPVVSLFQSFMENKEFYENTIGHLYQELVSIAAKSDIDINSRYIRFPKTSNYLTKELKIVDPAIKAIGFIIEIYPYTKSDGMFTKHASIIRITRKATQSTLDVSQVASPASLPSLTGNLGTKSGEATGEATGLDDHLPSPPNQEFTHKNDTGEAGEGSEAIPETFSGGEFRCKTCNAGPWSVNDKGSLGMKIIDFHKNQGHELEDV